MTRACRAASRSVLVADSEYPTGYPLERHAVKIDPPFDRRPADSIVLDLFAGPGGWDQGVLPLGLRPRGVEWDTAACETGRAAGHERVQADVAELEPLAFGKVSGLIASPPCQGFSMAGKGRGRDDSAALLDALRSVRTRSDLEAALPGIRERMTDHRTALVLEPLRYALALTPSWLAWEQVPAVLPVWEACAVVLRRLGYTVATGNLQAEQYGVPQTRKRAILVARAPWLTAQLGPATLPAPTHSRYNSRQPGQLDMTLPRWVSMAEALGWGMTRRPYPTLAPGTAAGGIDPQMIGGSGARRTIRRELEAGRWLVPANGRVRTDGGGAWPRHESLPAPTVTGEVGGQWTWSDVDPAAPVGWVQRERSGARAAEGFDPGASPAQTVTSKARSWTMHDAPAPAGTAHPQEGSLRLTVDEAAALQTFPAGYPWQGSRTAAFRQIGDAVPPLLAQHVVATVAGLALPTTTDAPVRVAGLTDEWAQHQLALDLDGDVA